MRLVRRAQRDEGGFSIVIVALLMVAMLTVAALAVDGGQAYADHRQMQNAADAGALAGTRALESARFRGGLTTDVNTQAVNEALNNGAGSSTGQVTCTVIDKNANTIAACTNTTTWASSANVSKAVGVKVTAGKTRVTALGGVIGVGSLSTSGTAAATIQPLTGGDAPFMVCGNAAFSDTESPPLLVTDSSQPSGWQVNTGQNAPTTPTAIGNTYDLHGPQVGGCGSHSNSFKGLANGPFTLPSWVNDSPGVRAGPTRSLVASQSGCSGSTLDNCYLLVPICSNGQGSGSGVQLYCVAWGTFLVHQVSANKHTGVFVGGFDATGGSTGTGDPNAGTVNVVKLIQ
ncbi:MAG: pilus assembly protein [Acidimicrobiia bacterium]|nr:pilus assembly protein [Acidimicrobiia bacterium]